MDFNFDWNIWGEDGKLYYVNNISDYSCVNSEILRCYLVGNCLRERSCV